MPDKDARFLGLTRLQTQLKQVDSLDQLQALLAAFGRDHMPGVSISVTADARDSSPTALLRTPIAGSGRYLLFSGSPTDDLPDEAESEILAAMIAAAPLFSNQVGKRPTTEARTAHVKRLADASHDMRSLQTTLKSLQESLMAGFGADGCQIGMLDSQSRLFTYPWMFDSRQTFPGERRYLEAGGSLLEWCFSSGKTFSSGRYADDSPLTGFFPGANDPVSVFCMPLALAGEVRGAICLTSEKEDAFPSDAQAELAAAAAEAASLLENARAADHLDQQLAELNTLYQASATMTANLDHDFVLEAVGAEMVRALQVDRCTIFVWDAAKRRLSLTAQAKREVANEDQSIRQESGLSKIENLSADPVLARVFETRLIHDLRRDQELAEDEQTLLERAELASVLLLPLVRRDSVRGLIALGQELQPRTFGRRELRLAQNLASQAAVAIEHAHLFAQSQRRVEELSTFQEIVLKLNTPLKLNAVLDTITESALKLVDASNLHIYLYNDTTGAFTFGSALWRDGRRDPAVIAPRDDGLTKQVVKQGQPIVINHADEHSFYQTASSREWGICAIAGFPLKHGDHVIGVFTATYLEPHVFTEDELLLLRLLADQAAVAVRNAGLYSGSQRRLKDMSALVDMAKQITGNLKLRDVLQTTVQILQGLLNARASTITMVADNGHELVVAAAAGVDPAFRGARMKLGEGISGEVVRKGELVYIRDAHSDPDFLFFDDVIRSLLVVPLVIRGQIIGTMTVDSAQANAFSDSDLQLMTIAAAQVSIAISNARFIEELESRAAELAVAYDELKESDRLKDELVQNVSHELRTPLTFVKGYVDLVLEGEMGELNEGQREALQIVADKTLDITRLIEDIITLQRINANNLQLEAVSVADLVKTAAAGHQMVADSKGLSVVHVVPEGDLIANLDKARINQVLDNIVGNAMKFSPDGGTITIDVTDEGSDIRVVISDQGIGVPKDKQERIFERFYQVDGSARRRFGGTGVGLAIVKRIVDAHGGRIWVESEPGQGSSFVVTLPKAPPALTSQPSDKTAAG